MVVGQFSEQIQGLVMSCAAANRLDSAALSKCRSATDSKWQKSSGEFHTKNQTSPQENDGLGPGNPPPNKKNSGQKNQGCFGWNLLGNLLKKLIEPSEWSQFFFQTEKGSKWRPSEWFTTGWRRKSLNMVNLLVQPLTK